MGKGSKGTYVHMYVGRDGGTYRGSPSTHHVFGVSERLVREGKMYIIAWLACVCTPSMDTCNLDTYNVYTSCTTVLYRPIARELYDCDKPPSKEALPRAALVGGREEDEEKKKKKKTIAPGDGGPASRYLRLKLLGSCRMKMAGIATQGSTKS
jgi:hypothetical protein